PLARALGRDATAVQLDEMPADREPEAEPAASSALDAFCLTKALEDLRQEIRADAAPLVRDDEPRFARLRFEADGDPAAGVGELDRVVEEVRGDLTEAVGVPDDLAGRRIELE